MRSARRDIFCLPPHGQIFKETRLLPRRGGIPGGAEAKIRSPIPKEGHGRVLARCARFHRLYGPFLRLRTELNRRRQSGSTYFARRYFSKCRNDFQIFRFEKRLGPAEKLFRSFRGQGDKFESIWNFLKAILNRDACHKCSLPDLPQTRPKPAEAVTTQRHPAHSCASLSTTDCTMDARALRSSRLPASFEAVIAVSMQPIGDRRQLQRRHANP
jgi:hypothetical protein